MYAGMQFHREINKYAAEWIMVDHRAVLLDLMLWLLSLVVASDGQTDERSILFVGSKDAVSISLNFVIICDLLIVDFVSLGQHLYYNYYLFVPLLCLLINSELIFFNYLWNWNNWFST